jgi:hypothetical protein
VCKSCSFGPWAFTGRVERVLISVVRGDGSTVSIAAGQSSDAQVWQAVVPGGLRAGDTVSVSPGDLRDAAGNTNATGASITVS